MFDASKFRIVRYKRGETIFKEGDPGYCAFMVLQGSVGIYKIFDGTKVTLTTLGKNQIFGEMGVITAEKRSAFAECVEECELVEIEESKLDVALKQGNVIIKAITQQLIKRLREKDSEMAPRHANNMFVSVCHLIALLKDGMGSEIPYAKLCSHAMNILAVSHLELNGMLKWMHQEGLLQIEGGAQKRVRLLDPNGFLTAAEALEADKPYPTVRQENEYIDIVQLAKLAGVGPKAVVAGVREGKIPSDMMFFSRSRAKPWLEENPAALKP